MRLRQQLPVEIALGVTDMTSRVPSEGVEDASNEMHTYGLPDFFQQSLLFNEISAYLCLTETKNWRSRLPAQLFHESLQPTRTRRSLYTSGS